MKRFLLSLALVMIGVCAVCAKSKIITPSINVKGTVIRDYGEIKSGTPALLLFGVKRPVVEPGDERYMAALLINDVWQLIPLDDWYEYFKPDSLDKDNFWLVEQLLMAEEKDKLGDKNGLRKELIQEADQYLLELEKSNLFYDDASTEDYLQCALLDILPQNAQKENEVNIPMVRILKSSTPEIMMLANHTLLISTGMLAMLDSEDELYALLAREVTHYMADHALITVSKNITRAKRAAFWGNVLDGVAAATEQYLYERYDYYEPGLVFATNDLVQALINQNIANRMGMDYSKEQENQADEAANRYLSCVGRHPQALASAYLKIRNHFQREKNNNILLPQDRDFLKRMRSIVSFEANMYDYNKMYNDSRRMATKNIDNQLACPDDYLLVARSLMKLSNTPESNEECWMNLVKADITAEVEDVNVTKMKILLKLRTNEQNEVVALVKRYQKLLDTLYQQPHTNEDAEWISAEHSWAKNVLERIYLK